MNNTGPGNTRRNQFTSHAAQAQPGLIAQLFDLLRHNKKWWLAPIILVLLFVSALILLSGTVAAPFIYTLF